MEFKIYCGRPEMRISAFEGLRENNLEDIELATLAIVFST